MTARKSPNFPRTYSISPLLHTLFYRVFLELEADLGVPGDAAGVALMNLVRSGAFTSLGSHHAYSPPTARSKHNPRAK